MKLDFMKERDQDSFRISLWRLIAVSLVRVSHFSSPSD